MGFFFRKSKSLGPIRLNFSKSGIGVSTGVKGARMVFSPKGTYVHLGRNGLYYRKHFSVKNNQNQNDQNNEEIRTTQIPFENQTTIETINFDNLTDIDSQEFIKELERKDKKVSFFNLLLFLGIVIFIAITIYFFIPYDFELKEGQVAVVSREVVNLREQNNINSNRVTQFVNGDKLIVVNDSIENGWIRVSKGKFEGFIYLPLVELKTEVISKIPIRRVLNNHLLAYAIYTLILVSWIFGLFKMHYLDKKRKSVELYYELDDEMNDVYEEFTNSFKTFLNIKRVW